MTDATVPEPIDSTRPETKTTAGALATYVGAFTLFAILTSTATDLSFLPDWLETIIYPLAPAVIGFLGSYMKSHKPGQLSASALAAARRTI